MLKIARFRSLYIRAIQIADQVAPNKCLQVNTTRSGDLVSLSRNFYVSSVLSKYNKKSRDQDSDSDDEKVSEFKDERDSKVIKTRVNSLRADLLLKAGLGMARNKVEANFYDSKIRVNGKKINKKSLQLNVGDEVDVIRGVSQTNPAHIVVARVVILDADEREEDISVSLRRYKSLLIDNYSGTNAFKSSSADQ